MFYSLLAAALLVASAGETLAAPQTTGTLLPLPTVCTTSSYGPFKLFATRKDTGDAYEVRLIADYTTTSEYPTSHLIINTNASCTNCGVKPYSWTLKSMQLYPQTSPFIGTTVNQDATAGSALEFVTTNSTVPSYPFYCVMKNSDKTIAPILSVHGDSADFSICAFTSVVPKPTTFSVVYKRSTIQPAGESCYPVTLTVQSIGIIPT